MPRRRPVEGIKLSKFKHSRRPENRVRAGERRIVFTLARLNGHFGKHYNFASQAKILQLLQRWFGITMSRRTLNRHFNALQQSLYIRRTRRHEYQRKRGMMFRSTLYHVGARYYGELTRHLLDLRKTLLAAGASSRVPEQSQYGEKLLKLLISGAGYPQGGAPPTG